MINQTLIKLSNIIGSGVKPAGRITSRSKVSLNVCFRYIRQTLPSITVASSLLRDKESISLSFILTEDSWQGNTDFLRIYPHQFSWP